MLIGFEKGKMDRLKAEIKEGEIRVCVCQKNASNWFPNRQKQRCKL
jgi:ABC-type xylose transport system substrate-binding protein